MNSDLELCALQPSRQHSLTFEPKDTHRESKMQEANVAHKLCCQIAF